MILVSEKEIFVGQPEGGVNMIKGYYATLLLNFGEMSGNLMAKANFRDLPLIDVLNFLYNFSVLFDELAKDPSFSRKRTVLVKYKTEGQKFKSYLENGPSKIPYYVIKGKEKDEFIEKLKNWSELLQDLESSHLFSTLSEDSPSKLFPNELVTKCGPKDFKDILDGAWCIVYGYSTPAAMILFRAAERESRKYYARVTGKSAPAKWYDLIEDMKKNKSAPSTVTSYMDFIRLKRNEAEHPDKRYTQEESEGILQQLSFLLKEIYK
jgi:hypothetical protein